MLTISKPLSAGQVQTYHKEEFANAQENYYSVGDRIRGEWHGRMAQEWGLSDEVREEHFQRLANGQHPNTGERQLFRGTVPPISDSARPSGGNQGHGCQTRSAHLPHAALRNEICKPRSRVL